MCFQPHEGPREVGFPETESGRWVRGRGSVFHGERASVWDDGKFWRRTVVMAAQQCECA